MRSLPPNGVYTPPPVHEGQVRLWIADILAGALAVFLAALLVFFVVVFQPRKDRYGFEVKDYQSTSSQDR